MGAVYLVRHGQASFGTADYDKLSALGVRQAEVFGAAMRARGLRFTRVLSGSLRRQRHTAEAAQAAAGLELPCEVDERWNEYDHFGLAAQHGTGAAEISSSREFQRVLDAALRGWIDGETAGPETWKDFRERGEQACRELINELGRGENALVFTSGGVIAALCTGLLGGPPETFVALNQVGVNTGVSKLVSGRSGVSLVSYNDHAHLEGDADLLSYR